MLKAVMSGLGLPGVFTKQLGAGVGGEREAFGLHHGFKVGIFLLLSATQSFTQNLIYLLYL